MAPAYSLDQTFLKSLYDSPTLSDVTVCFSDRRVHAHKVVLAMHSPYFQRAFAGDFKEAKSNELWLHEDDPDSVNAMLLHFYGHDYQQAVNSPGIHFNFRVFATADKYDAAALLELTVKELKNELCRNARSKMFPKLAYEVYENVPTHVGELKAIVLGICKDNLMSLYSKKDFRQLLLDVPQLGFDLLGKFVKSSTDESAEQNFED